MSIQSEIDRIKGHVADVYEAVEAKGGTLPNTQTSANMFQAVQSIPTNTGVEVQVQTGSYSTNSSGSATVSCGFKPDAVFLYATGGQYYSYGGVAFTAFNKTSGNSLIVGSSTSYAYANHTITQTSSGFSVSAKRYSASFKESNDSNRSIQYVAIKYTE